MNNDLRFYDSYDLYLKGLLEKINSNEISNSKIENIKYILKSEEGFKSSTDICSKCNNMVCRKQNCIVRLKRLDSAIVVEETKKHINSDMSIYVTIIVAQFSSVLSIIIAIGSQIESYDMKGRAMNLMIRLLIIVPVIYFMDLYLQYRQQKINKNIRSKYILLKQAVQELIEESMN